jgi:glycosyltransferase involved in cell wall biosynthesis
MYNEKTVSIILPAFNEEKSISKFIKDIKKLKVFDEIIAVNNNSTDRTKAAIQENDVSYFFEKKKGFGASLKKGLDNTKSDLIIICEPDGSFKSNDSIKLLKLSKKYDAVFTTRTNSEMNFYLKHGNKLYAKILSLLFNGPSLSDVGSSYRLFKRSDYNKFKKKLKYIGPEFQIELTINLINQNLKIIETPVYYGKRIGKSNYTGNFYSSFKVAIRFSKVVLLKFFRII